MSITLDKLGSSFQLTSSERKVVAEGISAFHRDDMGTVAKLRDLSTTLRNVWKMIIGDSNKERAVRVLAAKLEGKDVESLADLILDCCAMRKAEKAYKETICPAPDDQPNFDEWVVGRYPGSQPWTLEFLLRTYECTINESGTGSQEGDTLQEIIPLLESTPSHLKTN